eukprot:6346228-Prorocentrum_lima.AAC.1
MPGPKKAPEPRGQGHYLYSQSWTNKVTYVFGQGSCMNMEVSYLLCPATGLGGESRLGLPIAGQ